MSEEPSSLPQPVSEPEAGIMGAMRELVSGRGVSILDNLIEHVVYQDREMRVLWANRAACESVGVKREELIGRHCYELWPRRKDPCPDCPVIKAMQTGEPQKIEKTTPDGRPWLIKGFAMKDTDGGIIGAVKITLEITKRKRADEELKINRERLKTANSILRHDIANDVIVIKSALDIYRDENDETMLDEIEKRVKKSLNTIQKQRDQEEFIDSHSDLDEYQMEKVAHDVIKNYPNIKFSVTGTGTAYADNAIYSVFENIISNAIKHGKTNKLDIDISSGEEFCEIRFADYGIGIPDEYKYKIFDEGFSYGKTGHTGIGLYIVQQTVEDYDGEVFVEDNKPNGAVFVIRLRKIIER